MAEHTSSSCFKSCRRNGKVSVQDVVRRLAQLFSEAGGVDVHPAELLNIRKLVEKICSEICRDLEKIREECTQWCIAVILDTSDPEVAQAVRRIEALARAALEEELKSS